MNDFSPINWLLPSKVNIFIRMAGSGSTALAQNVNASLYLESHNSENKTIVTRGSELDGGWQRFSFNMKASMDIGALKKDITLETADNWLKVESYNIEWAFGCEVKMLQEEQEMVTPKETNWRAVAVVHIVLLVLVILGITILYTTREMWKPRVVKWQGESADNLQEREMMASMKHSPDLRCSPISRGQQRTSMKPNGPFSKSTLSNDQEGINSKTKLNSSTLPPNSSSSSSTTVHTCPFPTSSPPPPPMTVHTPPFPPSSPPPPPMTVHIPPFPSSSPPPPPTMVHTHTFPDSSPPPSPNTVYTPPFPPSSPPPPPTAVNTPPFSDSNSPFPQDTTQLHPASSSLPIQNNMQTSSHSGSTSPLPQTKKLITIDEDLNVSSDEEHEYDYVDISKLLHQQEHESTQKETHETNSEEKKKEKKDGSLTHHMSCNSLYESFEIFSQKANDKRFSCQL